MQPSRIPSSRKRRLGAVVVLVFLVAAIVFAVSGSAGTFFAAKTKQRLRPVEPTWLQEYQAQFALEHCVNFIAWRRAPKQPFTHDVTSSDATQRPVLQTTRDYCSSWRRSYVGRVAFTGYRYWEWLGLAVQLPPEPGGVFDSRLLAIDLSSKHVGLSGHFSNLAKFPEKLYDSMIPAVRPPVTLDVVQLDPQLNYVWGLNKFLPFPGHIMDDLMHAFGHHWTLGDPSAVLLLESKWVEHDFTKWITQYYAPKLLPVKERAVYIANNVSFAPVVDTGHTVHALNFVSKAIVPQLLKRHRAAGTKVVRRAVLMKTAIPNASTTTTTTTTSRKRGGAAVDQQELLKLKYQDKGIIRFSETFRATAAAAGWSLIDPNATTYDYRAFVTNTAEVIMLSWGGTMTVQTYAYGNRKRPLRIIMLLPPDRYQHEYLDIAHVFNGRSDLHVWYRNGWETRNYELPAEIKYIRIESNADELTVEDMQWQYEPFQTSPREARFWLRHGETAQRQELAARRLRIYNWIAQTRSVARRAQVKDAIRSAVAPAFEANNGSYYFSAPPVAVEGPWSLHVSRPANDGSIVALMTSATGKTVYAATPYLGVLADAAAVNLLHIDAFRQLRLKLDTASTATVYRINTTVLSVWLGGHSTQRTRGEFVQETFDRLGRVYLHVPAALPGSGHPWRFIATHVSPVQDAWLSEIASLVNASISWYPFVDADVLRSTVYVPAVVPVWTPACTYSQYVFARRLADASQQQQQQAHSSVSILPPAPSPAVAAAFKALGFESRVSTDLTIADCVKIANAAAFIAVEFGDDLLYLMSCRGWPRGTQVLRVIVLCKPEFHRRCGKGIHPQPAFFDKGADMALHGVALKYVLLQDAPSAIDEDVLRWWPTEGGNTDGTPTQEQIMAHVWKHHTTARPQDNQ